MSNDIDADLEIVTPQLSNSDLNRITDSDGPNFGDATAAYPSSMSNDTTNDAVGTATAMGNSVRSAATSVMDKANEVTNRLTDKVNFLNDNPNQSPSEFAAKLTDGLGANARDLQSEATREKVATRKGYSTALFVLLLIGAFTSLVFIWNKKTEKLKRQIGEMNKFAKGKLPKVAVPGIPNVEVPAVSVPNVQMPSVNVPNVNMPNIQSPSFNIPNVTAPNVNIPGVNIGGAVNLNHTANAARDEVTESRLERLIKNRLDLANTPNRTAAAH